MDQMVLLELTVLLTEWVDNIQENLQVLLTLQQDHQSWLQPKLINFLCVTDQMELLVGIVLLQVIIQENL